MADGLLCGARPLRHGGDFRVYCSWSKTNRRFKVTSSLEDVSPKVSGMRGSSAGFESDVPRRGRVWGKGFATLYAASVACVAEKS